MSSSEETLGSALRAARMGAHWMDGIHAYVRLEDLDGDAFRVDVMPPDWVPGRALKAWSGYHLAWWNIDSVTEELEWACQLVLAGGHECTAKKAVAFTIDNEGTFLAWLPSVASKRAG